MREIISRQNDEVKLITKLHSQKGRQIEQKFIAEGTRTCQALLESNKFPLKALYCTKNMLETADKIINNIKYSEQDIISSSDNLTSKITSKINNAKNTEKDIVVVSDLVMEKISAASSPSGILCVFEMTTNIKKSPIKIKNSPEDTQANDTITPGIVLCSISDPGNLGTLIRTCAAMGFETLVTIDCTDIFSPKVIQSSAGEIGKLNIFDLSWPELIQKKGKLELIALVVSGGQAPENINFENSLLVIGSEAHGIPDALVAKCEQKLTLPMPGKTESLNASVAGAIAMYLAAMKLK